MKEHIRDVNTNVGFSTSYLTSLKYKTRIWDRGFLRVLEKTLLTALSVTNLYVIIHQLEIY